jgi:hypothetical protein
MPIIGKTRLDWEVENTLMERAGEAAEEILRFARGDCELGCSGSVLGGRENEPMSSETFTFSVTGSNGSTLAGVLTSTPAITPPAPVLTTIQVSPASTTLPAGGTQQFLATGLDQNGNPLATHLSFTWTASAGTISASGLLTAPSAAGAVSVAASSGAVSGVASVTVTAAVPPTGYKPDLPSFPGQPVPQTTAIDAALPHDANGFIVPPIPSNPKIIGFSGNPGYQSTDFKNFNSAQQAAQADGSNWVCFRDGGGDQAITFFGKKTFGYSAAVLNNNINAGVQVSRIGPNGFADRSVGQLPILLAQLAYNNKEPLPNQFYVGLIWYADKRDPASPTYNAACIGDNATQQMPFGWIDGGAGANTGFFYGDDLHWYFFAHGPQWQSGNAYQFSHWILNHPTSSHIFNGPGEYTYGLYVYGLQDWLVWNGIFNQTGWNFTACPKTGDPRSHSIYCGVDSVNIDTAIRRVPDPQARLNNLIFCQAAAEGAQQNNGGYAYKILGVANPIMLYMTTYDSLVDQCEFDFDNQEFDAITSWCTLGTNNSITNAEYGKAGAALSLGPAGTPGNLTGYERGWGVAFDCVPSGTMQESYVYDKPDPINAGVACWSVMTADANKTPALLTTVGAIDFNNDGAWNFFSWTSSPNVSGPAGIQISPGSPAAQPTVNINGATVVPIQTSSGLLIPIPTTPSNPAKTVSAYAKTLGVGGVVDGPSFIAHAEQMTSMNWDQRFTASAYRAWQPPAVAA